MQLEQYQRMAARTLNPDQELQDRLANMVMGLIGESGELVDHIKKYLYHGHKLDMSYLKKELGDIMWYVAGMATTFDLDLNEIGFQNIEKLKARYPDGFSHEASRNRTE